MCEPARHYPCLVINTELFRTPRVIFWLVGGGCGRSLYRETSRPPKSLAFGLVQYQMAARDQMMDRVPGLRLVKGICCKTRLYVKFISQRERGKTFIYACKLASAHLIYQVLVLPGTEMYLHFVLRRLAFRIEGRFGSRRPGLSPHLELAPA